MYATVPQQIGKPAKSSPTRKFLSSFVSHRLAKYALRIVKVVVKTFIAYITFMGKWVGSSVQGSTGLCGS